MTWDDIWKTVLMVIASTGGIGGVIIAAIRFSTGFIAKRLEEKYALKLNEELEKYKSVLERRNYISKTKFDVEFSIYRELSKTFFNAAKEISTMIPVGLAKYPLDETARKEHEYKLYVTALTATEAAQDALHSNAPFISAELFSKFSEILSLCQKQLTAFDIYLYMASQREVDLDYQRSEEILKKIDDLNKQVREYLSTLEVID